MSFRRSASGLSNQHLFAGVDVVVYVEGGKRSPSLDEVLDGSFETYAIDILFWQKIFSVYCSNKKFHFRAIGSKHTILDIADSIIAGEVKNVYTAMDRDFDNFKGCLKSAPGIFYTRGYSWENEVWCFDIINDVFYDLCPVCHNSEESLAAKNEIITVFESFEKKLYWIVYLSILLEKYSIPFLPRKKPDSVFKLNNKKPYINWQQIHCFIRTAKSIRANKLFLGQRIQISPMVDCYGDFIATYCFRLLSYLLEKYASISSIQRQVINSLAISKFISKLTCGNLPQIFNHYKLQFDRLV